MILALQTSTFTGFGGIPTYNRMVCRALQELKSAGAAKIGRVLIANDLMADVERAATGLPNLALESFAGMAPELEKFFEEVMVMVDDPAVRANRMALLRRVGDAALKIADVTKIVVARRDYRA